MSWSGYVHFGNKTPLMRENSFDILPILHIHATNVIITACSYINDLTIYCITHPEKGCLPMCMGVRSGIPSQFHQMRYVDLKWSRYGCQIVCCCCCCCCCCFFLIHNTQRCWLQMRKHLEELPIQTCTIPAVMAIMLKPIHSSCLTASYTVGNSASVDKFSVARWA